MKKNYKTKSIRTWKRSKV